MIKALFIYSGLDRKELEKEVRAGRVPDTMFFGYQEVKRQPGIEADFLQIGKNDYKFLGSLFRKYLVLNTLFLLFAFGRKLRAYDVIVVGTSAYFNILFLRKLGFLRRQRFILINIDLTITLKKYAKKPFQKKIILSTLGEASFIVSLSKIQNKFLREQGFPVEKLSFVPLGVDTNFLKEMPLASDYVLTVGNDLGRDYDTFLKAMALMPDRKVLMHCSPKNIALLSVPVPPNVEVQMDKTHLDIKGFYAKANSFVIAMKPDKYLTGSDCSGQTAILDSLAYGRPVVATNSAWLQDYFEHGTNIMIVPPEDSKALAEAVERVLSDNALRTTLVREGRKLIDTVCNSQAMGRAIAKLILEAA